MSDFEREPTQQLANPNPPAASDPHGAIPEYLLAWSRYTLVGRLGSGGMGEVFKAWDPQLGRFVALKFLASSDPETLERFQHEARAQARVDHPAICKVFEVGDVAGRHYIAMQEIHGVTLDRATVGQTLEQKVQLVREIAEAMHAAHRLGLIHRDLKPGNILVEEAEDGLLRPFIVDFGLARDPQSPGAATISGMIVGTLGYMSPEQARGNFEEIDRRTDVYNLGVILYELVTGRLPHDFDSMLESLVRLQVEEPLSPRRVNAGLPADIETIVMKALEKEPARRYESAHALADDLRRFLDGEPIVARRASLLYRVRTRLRKHRMIAMVIGVAWLLLLAAGGYVLQERWRAQAREDLAQRFGMQIKEMELLTHVARMLPPERAVPLRSIVVPRMEWIRKQIAQSSAVAQGPGSYALARGSLALDDFEGAWRLLEETRQAGYETPDVHYARGQVLGHFYDEALMRTASINESEIRKAARRDAERRYRAPAVEELRQAAGASIEAPELLSAQIALYEERFEDAIAAARRVAASAPWLYEAALLEARVLRTQGRMHADAGKSEEALAHFASAADGLKRVIAIARSDAAVHHEACRLERQVLGVFRFQRRLTVEDVAKAGEPCVAATRLDPLAAGPWATFGDLHIILAEDQSRFGGDPTTQIAKARTAMERALLLDPTDAATLAGMGRMEMTLARWGAPRGIDPRPRLVVAQRLLTRAIAADPRATSTRITLANSLLTRGEHENRLGVDPKPTLLQAVDEARRILEIDEEIFLVHNILGNTYNVLADRETARSGDPRPWMAQAAKAFDRAIALNPSNASLHNNRGNTWLSLIEHRAGRGESIGDAAAGALTSYQRALEARPDYTLASINIAEVKRLVALDSVRHGQDPTETLREARASLDRYDAANEGDIDALVLRARCAIIEGRWRLAKGRDPREVLAVADEIARKTLDIESGFVAATIVQAERFRWEAEWRSRQQQSTTEPVRLGLEVVERAKKVDPQNPEALAIEAALLFIDARGRDPESAEQLRRRAGALVDQALRAKPSLRPDYGSLK